VILTDREIQTALKKGVIVIDPSPPAAAYSSTTVDLTLDPFLTIFEDPVHGVDAVLDPAIRKIQIEDLLRKVAGKREIDENGYVLAPSHLVLGYTREYVDLRSDTKYAARVEGKSSLARLGVAVHMTAPTIHAGFDGQIRLEIVNHGRYPVRLRAGMPICQLVFEQTLGTPDKGYSGQFSGQKPS
jgi:dCTP deaminase